MRRMHSGRTVTRGTWAVAAALLAPPALAESYDLTPKFDRPGYFEFQQSTQQTMTGAMMPEGQSMVITSDAINGVWQRPAGERKVELEFDRLAMSLKHPMLGEMGYDTDAPPSDDAEENTFQLMFKSWPGKRVQATIDERNRVSGLEGFDAIFEQMEDDAAGDMLYEQIRPSLTPESYKSLLIESRFVVLPDKPVAVGDTWKATYENAQPNLGELVFSYDCKLDKVADGVAVVSYRGTARVADDATPPNLGGMTPDLKSWEFEGDLRFDLEQHTVVAQSTRGRQTLQLKMGAGDAAQTLDVDAKMEMEVKAMSKEERAAQQRALQKAASEAASEAASAPSDG